MTGFQLVLRNFLYQILPKLQGIIMLLAGDRALYIKLFINAKKR